MKNRQPHKFIVIEGICGSGKTAISRALAERMSAVYYATPPSPFREIRELADRTLSLESRFLFYLSSVMHASWEIGNILQTQTVVCDKYIWSTVCYHAAYGLDVRLPSPETYLQPDHVFLVVCEEEERLLRVLDRRPVEDMRTFHLQQQLERKALQEFRRYIEHEVDDTHDDPAHAVAKIVAVIQGE